MHDYEFRLCRPEEAAEVFRLICERTRWMDEVGIRQWNHTDYLNVFPLSYYEQQQAEGTLYALSLIHICRASSSICWRRKSARAWNWRPCATMPRI